MQYTPNYNLTIAEGADAVNPLTQIFPNFSTIDGAMEDNKEAGIGTASEVTTGGVHAIVRTDPNIPVFRYTATSAWTTGDTMTLDGSAVTVHLSDGTAPKSGAYVIGAEVLAVVNGSLVTLLTSKEFEGVVSFNSRNGVVVPQSGDYTANQIGYNNTGSGLSSTDTQGAIDELAANHVKITELYTNSNPTNAFAAQNINLDNSNYKLLLWLFYESTSAVNGKSAIFSKGSGVIMDEADAGHTYIRVATRVSDTQYSVGDCHKDNTTDNSLLIPYKVYGIDF